MPCHVYYTKCRITSVRQNDDGCFKSERTEVCDRLGYPLKLCSQSVTTTRAIYARCFVQGQSQQSLALMYA